MFIGDDWHHNGAFRLTYAFAWLNFAAQDRDAYRKGARTVQLWDALGLRILPKRRSNLRDE